MLGRGSLMKLKLKDEEKLPPIRRTKLIKIQSSLLGAPPLIPRQLSSTKGPPSSSPSSTTAHQSTTTAHQSTTTAHQSTRSEVTSSSPVQPSVEQHQYADLPERPAFSIVGEKIEVLTNFIRVRFPNSQTYQYHVTMDPEQAQYLAILRLGIGLRYWQDR
eukprot:sb/3472906/